MSRATRKDDAAKSIIKGIEDAQTEYVKWSGGDWIWDAPEYLITTCIAKRLARSNYVTLESNVTRMLREAGAVHCGAPSKKLRKNGRFDIVLWRKNGAPRAAIEVKNRVWRFRQIEGDIERLIELVAKKQITSSTFQFGAVAFYTCATENNRTKAGDQLKNLDTNLFKQFSSLVVKHNRKKEHDLKTRNVPTQIYCTGKDAWVARCYVIY